MAVEIVWLDQAKDDLREILDFIADENPGAAANYVAGITEACNKLADFPEFGLHYNSEFRRLVFAIISSFTVMTKRPRRCP